MKPNVNTIKNRLALSALLLFGGAVIVAAAFAAGDYSKSVQQLESNERDAAVMERIFEAKRANLVLSCLNRGHEKEARQYLSCEFVDNVKAAKALALDASPKVMPEIKIALTQFAQDQRAHPEYYAAANPPAQAAPSIQLARHSAKP